MDVAAQNAQELINQINTLNALSGSHTVTLNGTDDDYIISSSSGDLFGPLAFPVIRRDIRIVGQGRAITRALGAPPLRFFGVVGRFSRLTLENLKLFNGDSGLFGGGALVADGHTIIRDCHFSGNRAGTYGGAIYAGDTHTVQVSNTTFSYNTAAGVNARGGAIYASTFSTVTLTGCTFFRNRVVGSGSRGSALSAVSGTRVSLGNSNLSCNLVESSSFNEAVHNVSGNVLSAQNNWWGAADGPSGSGQTGSGQPVGGLIDASNPLSAPGTQIVSVWYDRSAAANYGIVASRNNFEGSFFETGNGNLTASSVGSVGGPFTYPSGC